MGYNCTVNFRQTSDFRSYKYKLAICAGCCASDARRARDFTRYAYNRAILSWTNNEVDCGKLESKWHITND